MACKRLRIGSALLLVVCALALSHILLPRQTHARAGSTIYVAPGGDCGGVSPCYAHPQDAVDAASHGDAIKIATGRYTGINHYAGLAQVLYLDKSVTIRGGYTITDWTISDPDTNPTTLDAQKHGRVIYIRGNSPVIEGLRITGGDTYGLGGKGGGVYGTGTTVTISNCRVLINIAELGGGLALYGSDVTLRGNTIAPNVALDRGGGLLLYDSSATLTDNVISSNRSRYGGGGLFVDTRSKVTLIDNTISFNTTAGGWGGGLYLYESTATLNGNTFSHNKAEVAGGGLGILASTAALRGNTVFSNTALYGGGLMLTENYAALTNNFITDNALLEDRGWGSGLAITGGSLQAHHNTIARNRGGSGVHVREYGTVDMINTILVGHTVGIYVEGHTALEGTLWGSGPWANDTDWSGPGSITTGAINLWGDPDFVDPDIGDYHIGLDSAAIDAGIDCGVTTDIDGDQRPIGAAVDIGADEASVPLILTLANWNLISFNREPRDTRISSVLAPIDGLYSVVMAYDGGSLSYYPDIPEKFNTLKGMDPYHGYWIKTTTTATLPIYGPEVAVDTPLSLDKGWNLVSYLPNSAYTLTTALASIEGQYEAVLGYDRGAMSAYPKLPDYMNTLQTLEPQRGYWIKMKQVGTLIYPRGEDGLAAPTTAANAAQIPATVTPTNQWVDVYSLNTTVNARPIPTGSTITAYDSDGVRIGECVVKQLGSFGVLSLYGDDVLTPEDEGAEPGDTITFYINGCRATAIGPDEPIWTTFGDLREVDLTASYHLGHQVYLPLMLK